jgi:hypothetical protein
MLFVENIALECEPLSDAAQKSDRDAENLHFGAKDTLHKASIYFMLRNPNRFDNHEECVNFLLATVALHFGVSRMDLWNTWRDHYGPQALERLEKRQAQKC